MKITIPLRHDYNTGDVIEFNGKKYVINRVDSVDSFTIRKSKWYDFFLHYYYKLKLKLT
jgi:hypothetical protein